jgi:hypothetical protein
MCDYEMTDQYDCVATYYNSVHGKTLGPRKKLQRSI